MFIYNILQTLIILMLKYSLFKEEKGVGKQCPLDKLLYRITGGETKPTERAESKKMRGA